MKKKMAGIVVIITAVTLLAGCTAAGSQTSSDSAAEEAVQAETAEDEAVGEETAEEATEEALEAEAEQEEIAAEEEDVVPEETTEEETAEEEPTEEANGEPALLGGFQAPDSPEVTEEVKALIDKAVNGLVGAEYEPVAYIGKQIVNGTNHLILCTITPVIPDPTGRYALVKVYEDLNGNASIEEIYESESEAPKEGLLGGWTVSETPVMTEEAEAALQKAAENLLGAEYTPCALLATQVVSGTNYSILCKIQAVAPGAEERYAVVQVYEDLDGNAEVTETFDFYGEE